MTLEFLKSYTWDHIDVPEAFLPSIREEAAMLAAALGGAEYGQLSRADLLMAEHGAALAGKVALHCLMTAIPTPRCAHEAAAIIAISHSVGATVLALHDLGKLAPQGRETPEGLAEQLAATYDTDPVVLAGVRDEVSYAPPEGAGRASLAPEAAAYLSVQGQLEGGGLAPRDLLLLSAGSRALGGRVLSLLYAIDEAAGPEMHGSHAGPGNLVVLATLGTALGIEHLHPANHANRFRPEGKTPPPPAPSSASRLLEILQGQGAQVQEFDIGGVTGRIITLGGKNPEGGH